MKLLIDGREYDGSAQPYVGDLRLLKRTCGFGYGTVIDRMQNFDEDSDVVTMLDNDEFLEAFIAWIWMSRLRSGERDCTFETAGMVALDQVQWVREAGDELPPDDADPTSAPTGSGRGANGKPARPARTPATSRT